MGRASAVLAGRRPAAFAALGAAVGAYYVWRASLPDLPYRWDVALLVFPIVPAVLGLILIVLPLWELHASRLLAAVIVVAAVAFVCEHEGWPLAANFAKLFAPALLGWLFLGFFEAASWVVLVACLVPFVDAFSVFSSAGPTHHIVTNHEQVFTRLSIAFPVPHAGAARLGLPDVLFFSLFLGAAARFRLRVPLTFALTALSFGATVVLTNVLDLNGLPALPLLSIGFLAANADVLWRRRRAERPAA